MPHQIIEYSANLDSRIDVDGLVVALHEGAAAIEVLPVAGLRTRAVASARYRIADGHPDNAFVNVMLRIAPGRSAEQKKDAGDRLFGVLCDYLDVAYKGTPLALSYEIQEIDAELRWKQNNLRSYLEQRAQDSSGRG